MITETSNGGIIALHSPLSEKKMKDAKIHLCIPATDADNESPIVFKTGHLPEYKRDPEMSMLIFMPMGVLQRRANT